MSPCFLWKLGSGSILPGIESSLRKIESYFNRRTTGRDCLRVIERASGIFEYDGWYSGVIHMPACALHNLNDGNAIRLLKASPFI